MWGSQGMHTTYVRTHTRHGCTSPPPEREARTRAYLGLGQDALHKDAVRQGDELAERLSVLVGWVRIEKKGCVGEAVCGVGYVAWAKDRQNTHAPLDGGGVIQANSIDRS